MEPTASITEQAHHTGATGLENLPSEIKVMILCHMPSLSSLSGIVHASPTYYQAYLIAREEILHNITIQTLQKNNLDLLDAWTAIHIPQLDHLSPHCTQMIREYLERYAWGRMDSGRRRLAPQDSLAILSLHKKFTVLIAKYCKAVFSENVFTNPFTEAADSDPLPPSQSESHRLYRALWRYKIYSQLFGPGKDTFSGDFSMAGNKSVVGIGPPNRVDYTFIRPEIAREFFGLFPIHEVEELACLEKYARDYYYSTSFYPLVGHERDQLVALGPEQLYQVMTATSKDEHNARVVEGLTAECVYFTMEAAFDAYERDINWGSWQSNGIHDNCVSEAVAVYRELIIAQENGAMFSGIVRDWTVGELHRSI